MHNEVEEVEQDPFGPAVALDLEATVARPPECLVDGVGDRFGLPRMTARADDEEVGEGAGTAQVEDDDVGRFLGLGGPDSLGEFMRQGLR